MTAKSKQSIKAFFETGDKPTQSQFIDFIDSYVDAAGPIGSIEAAASAGSQGFAFVSGFHGEVLSGPNALSFMGATVVTTAQTQAVIPYATTAQAVAGVAQNVVMDAVSTKNAIAALGTSELVLLATATAASSSTINFASLISSSYSAYVFVLQDIELSSAAATFNFNVSTDNGATWTAGAITQKEAITLGGTTAPTYTGASGTGSILTTSGAQYFGGTIRLISPTSQTTAAAAGLFSDILDAGGNKAYRTTALFNSSLVNAIQFLPSTGNIAVGKIYMYGVKNT